MSSSRVTRNSNEDEPVYCWIFDCYSSSQERSVFIAQNFDVSSAEHTFTFDTNLKYHPFCDDFGPMNFACIVNFIEELDRELDQSESGTLVYCAGNGRRALTNAAFLLGAYMLLCLDMRPLEVSDRFKQIRRTSLEAYRDATFSPPDFGLQLVDCWAGIHRAMARRWLALPGRRAPRKWGAVDVDEYLHYDNPLNADLHEVVPGKFVAFRGPRDLPGGRDHYDDPATRARDFSPAYYCAILRALGVTTVLRLNGARYDARAFAAAGLDHHDLFFDDCAAPPPAVVARFFAAADAAPGLVAVHC